MKLKNILFISGICLLFTACYKPGDIQVQNRISNVKWGDVLVASELLPLETSDKFTVDKNTKKLPSKARVSFKMNANKRTVFLQTVQEYSLDQDGYLLIILADDTPVSF